MNKKKAVTTESEDLDETAILDAGSSSEVSDELSLQKAASANSFKLFIVRLAIKLKNHISILPLLMSVVSLIIITCTIPWHVNAMVMLHNNELNAFFFFVTILLSLLTVMAYMNVSNKKSSTKKKILLAVVFGICLIGQLVLDYYYIHDVNVETSLFNSINKVTDDAEHHYVSTSLKWINVHVGCLYATAALAILAPIVQPFTKKIKIRVG